MGISHFEGVGAPDPSIGQGSTVHRFQKPNTLALLHAVFLGSGPVHKAKNDMEKTLSL